MTLRESIGDNCLKACNMKGDQTTTALPNSSDFLLY